jgi:hypothetical protein
MIRTYIHFTVFLGFLFFAAEAKAFDGFHFFVTPGIGYSWYTFKSIEVEDSFLGGDDDEPLPPTQELSSKDMGGKSFYEGGGLNLSVSAGVKILALRLGVYYSWTPVNVEGYSKRYEYDPLYGAAYSSPKNEQSGTINVQRVFFEAGYGLPIWKFELVIKTRIGSIYIDENDLPLGRAVEGDSGFAGELGLGLNLHLASFFEIGIEGDYGFFSFDGMFEELFGKDGQLVLLMSFIL